MLDEINEELFTNGFLNFVIYTTSILIITFIVTKIIKKFQNFVQSKYSPQRITAYKYLFKTLRAIIYIFASFAILSEIKPMKSLGTALLGATSVLAVIVGLAAQESFGNYISGFFLAMYEPFHLGDVISLPEKNIYGTVKEINFRHIVIETINSSKVLIPNSVMNSAVIEDRTGNNYKNKIYVSVTYDTDIDKARKVIQDIVYTEEKKYEIFNKNCDVYVEQLNDSSVDLCFFVEGKTVADSYTIACSTREEILKKFRENNIEIAFPTRTVYLEKDMQ